MKMAVYGYARVSTNGQSLGDQIAALRAAGATMIYKEKVSGIRADRPQLAKMIKALGAGDVVVVSRLDRLARSTRDLLNIVDAIAKAGASFKSIADAWADTTTPHGKLMLTVLGGLAEFEHSLIKARIDAARARQGGGRAVRPQAQARCLSAGRGAQAVGGWRGHERRCQELSRERADDLAAAGGSVMSNKPLPKNSSMPDEQQERAADQVAVRKADDGDNETNNIETPDYDEHRVKKSAD
jgi:DNA invertase Pin-like site-specific DNA recombinase